MTDITMTEWRAREAEIASGLKVRWPWLATHGGLTVETPALAATAELRTRSADMSATVRVCVDKSCGISGGVADIAEAARQIAEVRDAMLYVHGETSDLVIWQDGECPCSHCSGRGSNRSGPCGRCGGKGKR